MYQVAFPSPIKDRNLQFAICNLQSAISSLFPLIILIIILSAGIPLRAQSHGSGESAPGVDKSNNPQNRAGQGGENLSEKLKQELGAAAVKEDDNPLLNITRSMIEVRRRMMQNDAGAATLAIEKQIVADLDQLIDQVRKSAGQSSSSASSPKQPLPGESSGLPSFKPGAQEGQKSSDKSAAKSPSPTSSNTQSRKPDMQEMQAVMKKLWGELPANVRQQMLQTPPEEFVPKYEGLIEEYYRRLSDEKKGDRESGMEDRDI